MLCKSKHRLAEAWWQRTRQAVAAAASKQALPLLVAGPKGSQASILEKAATMSSELVDVLRSLVMHGDVAADDLTWAEETTLVLESMRDEARPLVSEAFEDAATALVALQELLEICAQVLKDPGWPARLGVLKRELSSRKLIVDRAIDCLQTAREASLAGPVELGSASAAALAILEDVEELRGKGKDVAAVEARARGVLELLKRTEKACERGANTPRQETLDVLAAKLAQLHRVLLDAYKGRGWLRARWTGVVGAPLASADVDVNRACDELCGQTGLRRVPKPLTYGLEEAMLQTIQNTARRRGGTFKDAALALSKDAVATQGVALASNVSRVELKVEMHTFSPEGGCPYCGASHDLREARFCPTCGHRIASEENDDLPGAGIIDEIEELPQLVSSMTRDHIDDDSLVTLREIDSEEDDDEALWFPVRR